MTTTTACPVLDCDSITDKLHELVRSSQRRVLVVIAGEDTWPRLLIAYRRHLAGAGIPVVPAGQPPMPGVGTTGAWTTATTQAAALRADAECRQVVANVRRLLCLVTPEIAAHPGLPKHLAGQPGGQVVVLQHPAGK